MSGNDLVIQNIKTELAKIATGVDEDTRALAGVDMGKRLSIKGGVFRKFAQGKEVGMIEDRHMNVIFVKVSHTNGRAYYSQTYEEGVGIAPDCWSSDTKYPDAAVTEPKSASCSTCKFSVDGSGKDGKGSACRFQRRTAVVLPNDPAGDVLQLVLPATSIFGKEDNGRWPFIAYGQMLAANNISLSRVVTRMAFDTKAATPKLVFSPAAPVDGKDVDTIKAQAQSSAAQAAIEMRFFRKRKEVAPVEVAAPTPPTAEETVPEPTVRAKPAPVEVKKEADVPDIIAKWASKKS